MILTKGGLTLNPGSTRVYTPVLRGPLLFHQNTPLSVPSYYTAPRPAAASSGLYLPPTSPYTRQSPYPNLNSPPLYPQAYLYYSTLPGSTFPSQLSFPYSPNATYGPTVAYNGLTLILIATLILVALDLAIVRPQKRLR